MKVTHISFLSIAFICGALVTGFGAAWYLKASHHEEPDATARTLGKRVTLSNEYQELTFGHDGSIESIDNKN